MTKDEVTEDGVTKGGAPGHAPGRTGAGSGQELPPHVTLPLLSLITSQSMDEDYQHVAQRRGGGQVPRTERPTRDRVVTALVVAVFGALVAVAGVQTSRNADVDALGRASLVSQIQAGKTEVRDLQDRAGELKASNADHEQDLRVLRERESNLSQQVSRMAIRTGYLPVRGPGLRITVDSAPGAVDSDVVQDDDLLFLVDGLWAAGAEAIAINGQRLTTLSSIQNSGKAIHVNVRPLSPPYVITAIGDPDTLEARLLRTTHGSVFYSLARSLEFRFEIEQDDRLELPAARTRRLLHATDGVDSTSRQKEMAP